MRTASWVNRQRTLAGLAGLVAAVLAGCFLPPPAGTGPAGPAAGLPGVVTPTAGGTGAASPAPATTAWEAPRVTAAEAQAMRARGEDFLIVDVRPQESYDLEHVEGAVNAPWITLAQGHAQLPKERLLLLYCT